MFNFVIKSHPVKYCCLLVLLWFVTNSTAQRILVLEKIGTGRMYAFSEGDKIQFETKSSQLIIADQIIGINDSSLLLHGGFRVDLKDILYIEKFFKGRKKNGILLIAAGGILIGITAINNLSYNNPVVDPVFLAVGSALSGAGGLWYSLAKRKYYIGRKWKIKVLDYSF